MDSSLQLALDLAVEKGATTWLTALPLDEYRMLLSCDMVGFLFVPQHTVIVEHLSVEHALSCPNDGLPSIRHNEVRDLTATLLTEVCSHVATEPELQPVSQEEFSLSAVYVQDGARMVIVMDGFWGEVRECLC